MSIENFKTCLNMLLEHEGGFVNHPSDPGGMTNLGVTKAVYDKFINRESTEEEMRALTPIEVAPIYKKNYWDRGRCDDLPSGVDWSVFDWGVNSGVGRSAKALQRIVGVTADGGIGPMTLKAVANFEPKDIIVKMHATRQKFYEGLTTFKTFGKGWTRRNNETLETALKMIKE
jgi:lysozyme family protein